MGAPASPAAARGSGPAAVDEPTARGGATEAGPGPGAATVLLVAAVVGVADAVLFVAFERSVDDGTDWLWNSLVGTDDSRWRVVPLAMVAGVGFSLVLRLVGQHRSTEPETSLMADLDGGAAPTASLTTIVVTFVVGLASLVAGASLGPEASLVAVSVAVGAWLAGRAHLGPAAPLLVLASVGALFVVFVGSLVPLLIPVLLLVQRHQATLRNLLVVVVCGGVAYLTLLAIGRGHAEGYGSVPTGGSFAVRDVITAAVLGAVAAVVARIFDRCVAALAAVTRRIDAHLAWPLSAAVFGAGLGLAYWAGGEPIEFSGSDGTVMLVERAASYSTVGLAGLAAAKLVATAWSLSSGYRGGVVFPSVFTAVAVGLFVARAASGIAGPGVVIGVVAGILGALVGPAVALALVVSVVPAGVAVLGIVGVGGAVVGDRLLSRLGWRRPADAG